MANDKKFVVKNGLTAQNISFVDDTQTTNNTITVTMLDSDTLSFSGESGQLFSITDTMSGTIFAVNDISGVPSIEVDDDGTVRFAETFGNVLVGTATDDGTNKLQVNGNIALNGAISADGSIGANGQVLTSDGIKSYWSSALGFTGSQGDVGFTGSRGDVGYTGSQGDVGFTGSFGFTGSRGDTGFTGSRGDVGFTGSQGDTGFTGSIGFTGSQGAGFTGSAGSVGFTGSQGDIGFTGSQGAGFTGSRGDTGFTGSIGFTGSQGAGFTGSRGDTGFTGSVGFTGSIGFTGSKGESGIAGFLADVSNTAPNTTTEGHMWFDTNDASLSIYYDDGDSEQWVTVTGARGLNGYTGSVGFTGSIGGTGFTGSRGQDGNVTTGKAIAMAIVFG